MTALRGIFKLLRLPYWFMTGGLSLLTLLALASDWPSLKLMALTFFSMAFLGSAGFAINDYFDRQSDAVIKPNRPIPKGEISPETAVTTAIILFALSLILGYIINPASFIVITLDAALLVLYSAYIKRKSGFAANTLVGLLTGTAFIYGETAGYGVVTVASASIFPLCLGTIGGNILRDILSMDGDSKVNYPTLPLKVGVERSVKIAAPFFIICAILAPIPFILRIFGVAYLIIISMWSISVLYASISLLRQPLIDNIKRKERMMTMGMILIPIALIAEVLI
ncbi:MAG: UbiA family prenyltransferase [Candidatus Bathyarchaeia archaeon]